MTREELEKTPWAKKFKRECPSSYSEAIELALSPDFAVSILYTDEIEIGNFQYVIEALDENLEESGFWMETCKRKDHAIALCQKMEWRIVE